MLAKPASFKTTCPQSRTRRDKGNMKAGLTQENMDCACSGKHWQGTQSKSQQQTIGGLARGGGSKQRVSRQQQSTKEPLRLTRKAGLQPHP